MKKNLPLTIPVIACLALLACSPRPVAVPTGQPLSQAAALISIDYEEAGTGPDYTLTTHTPRLTGPEDPRLAAVNTRMADIVQEEQELFKQNLSRLAVEPVAMGSYLEVGFEQVSPPGKLLSLKYHISFYIDGAAHPGLYYRTATFDLQTGSQLALEQLFRADADPLAVIADYCIAELRAGDIGFDPAFFTGAEPSGENYRNWNVAAESLLITFDPYQVAAYAAGPQTVSIPYSILESVIDPRGPLAGFFP